MPKDDKKEVIAEESSEQEAEKKAKPSVSGQMFGLGLLGKIVGITVSFVLVSTSYYAFFFFAIAMLPSLLTVFVDRSPGRYTTKTIAACNFIGVMPYLYDIALAHDRDLIAEKYLYDYFVWMFVYCAAAIGFILVWFLPQLAMLVYVYRSDVKINNILQEQKALIEEWGEEIKEGNKK